MSENPYQIQVKKRIQIILIYNMLNFIPGLLILLFFFGLFFGLPGMLFGSFNSLTSVFILLIMPVFVFYLILWVIQIIYNYLYLSSLNYSVTGKNFFFAGGILSKFEKNLPYSRIQHVIIYESFWQRMFGLASVSIETAGGSGSVSIEYQNTLITTGPLIPDLKKEDAEKLKNRIISISQKYKSVAGV